MSVKQLKSNNDFLESINNQNVIVDFYADWCGPCKMLSPIIDQLSDEYKNISFCKVNVDELNDVASQFNIMSIPTVILFSNKKMISSFTGFLPKEQIINFINQNLQKK